MRGSVPSCRGSGTACSPHSTGGGVRCEVGEGGWDDGRLIQKFRPHVCMYICTLH